MEEAAIKRLERLRNLQLGNQEPAALGGEINTENNLKKRDEREIATTAESLAQQLIRENSFVPSASEQNQPIPKANWDLKREYGRKMKDLDEGTKSKIEEYVLSRIDGTVENE